MSATRYFSGLEVIRAAMEVEKNGHRFYSSMAEKAHTELARELFFSLAQDEVTHLKTLENLVPKYQDGEFWNNEEDFIPYLLQFNDQVIFPSAEQVAAALVSEDGDIRALDLAIAAEEKFAEYFHMAAAHARSADGKKAFSWLASEEDRHAEILKERKVKILAAAPSR
ncbi:MAG: ferritin family protein [Deltaproteobacteria bacterium]|nr:ferritin family protein [Deltaproteobacteria bacterium]